MTTAMRDTDQDWRLLGETDPFWAVLSTPEFHTDGITPEAVERFYALGRLDIELFAGLVERASGTRPAGGTALDFGCGVGRLSEALADLGFQTTGVDVSPGMLAKARLRGDRVSYRGSLPDGAFDWVVSHIVFQHIPPARGLVLMGELVDRLAPGGALSLHVQFGRPAHLRLPQAAPPPPGVMQMYDYDMSAVLETLWTRGVRRLHLHPPANPDCWGFVIAGRREFA